MTRIAVVDDDRICLKQVCEEVERQFTMEKTIKAFSSSILFFQAISDSIFDIVFLDIDMPEMNGFEVAKNLKKIKSNTVIFFVSGLENLVFDAFEFKPLGFVRKSKLSEDMQKAIKTYENDMSNKNDIYFFYTYELDLAVLLSEIVYFESMGHELYVMINENKYRLKKEKNNFQNLFSLEKQYEQQGFIRIHRSYLVNYRHIYKIKRNSVVLKNGAEININPHNVNNIKNMYQQFLVSEE